MIAVPHPIRRFIDDECTFLELLIRQFPALHDEWKSKTLKEFEEQAAEVAEGDDEVQFDVYHSLANGLDAYDCTTDTFRRAMLVMAYSYYDTAVQLLCRNTNKLKPLEFLCVSNQIPIEKEVQEDIDFLDNLVRPLRNYLVHNNRPDDIKKQKGQWKSRLEKVCKERSDTILTDDGRLVLTDNTLAIEALKRAHRALSYVASKLGYGTRYTGRNTGTAE